MHDPHKGYAALRRGRWSAESVTYFITICARRPSELLAKPAVRDSIRARFLQLETENLWHVRCAVVMPDHLHLLVTLTSTHQLSECIRLFKGPLTPPLRTHGAAWQPSFYDLHLRHEEELLPAFLYVFLNPYRAGLVAREAPWPGYFCCPEDWDWFSPLTNESLPEPEWLRD